MELCNECPCNCKPVSDDCIVKNSDIHDASILKDSHFQKATDDIDDLIGIDCADAMCEALTQAVQEVNDNPGTSISDHLASKWLNIIENRHFKKWYSNRLLWHWVFGASTSELTLSGLVVLNNSDDDYKNNFTQAVEKERQRVQDSAKFYSDAARKKFLDTYWNKNASLYTDCIESECTKEETCQKPIPPNNGIGMTVI